MKQNRYMKRRALSEFSTGVVVTKNEGIMSSIKYKVLNMVRKIERERKTNHEK